MNIPEQIINLLSKVAKSSSELSSVNNDKLLKSFDKLDETSQIMILADIRQMSLKIDMLKTKILNIK
jgi:hypothetical protein